MNFQIDHNRADIKQLLIDLHESYLKDNKYDEGDLLYYRINYRVMDAFQIRRQRQINFIQSTMKMKGTVITVIKL